MPRRRTVHNPHLEQKFGNKVQTANVLRPEPVKNEPCGKRRQQQFFPNDRSQRSPRFVGEAAVQLRRRMEVRLEKPNLWRKAMGNRSPSFFCQNRKAPAANGTNDLLIREQPTSGRSNGGATPSLFEKRRLVLQRERCRQQPPTRVNANDRALLPISAHARKCCRDAKPAS